MTAPDAPWQEFARAPLAPLALAAGLGLAVEHYYSPLLEASFAVAAFGILAWSISRRAPRLFLAVAFAGLAAAHLHVERHVFASDDVGEFAAESPSIAKVRGFLEESPILRRNNRTELFGPARRVDRAATVVRVSQVSPGMDPWRKASGLLKVTVECDVAAGQPGVLDSLAVGDEVEMVGLLSTPATPGNPGERDYAAFLRDRRIRAELRITKDAQAVTRLDAGGWGWSRFLAALRGRFTTVLKETLPPGDQPLARALLLGDTAATGQEEWDAFARTGVIHVLAISGQHLVILAGAAWLLLRLFGVPRRRGAWLVIALIVGYAALTGGRPSANRAAVMVAVYCGAIIVRRPFHTANAFSLAWLIVVALDPADALTIGSLLSFFCVFVLIWGVSRWSAPAPESPVEQLQREARPPWLNALRGLGRIVLIAYVVNLTLAAAITPLLISLQNVAPPVGILIGPPLILLTTIALLAGFVQLLLGLVSPLLAAPFAFVTGESLALSKSIVTWADRLPGGSIYLPDVPLWWLVGFYLILAVTILVASNYRLKCTLLLAGWTLLGLSGGGERKSDELRVTFLSVGHGGCTVLETPDGRVILYDTGTMAGPDTVKRIVAPFLWHRGIRRVDELILSHADLDHFNGVPELLRRFPVGQVTMAPTFAEKKTPEVAEVLLAFESHGVPRRLAVAGESFAAGEVTIHVLHPPHDAPGSTQNEHSLVLKIVHRDHSFLLTGDLEKAGTSVLLATPPQTVDVLMAPHHGSPPALPAALMKWASPKLVVVSRGPRNSTLSNAPDAWDTWTRGAITFRSHASGLSVESFRTKQREVVKRGKSPL